LPAGGRAFAGFAGFAAFAPTPFTTIAPEPLSLDVSTIDLLEVFLSYRHLQGVRNTASARDRPSALREKVDRIIALSNSIRVFAEYRSHAGV